MATQHLRRVIAACVLFVCMSESTTCQTTGRITGVVKDASGGVIARAEVQAVNEATGEEWKAVTDEAGNYSFLLLPPGLYQIEVAANGFETAVLKDIRVRITETTTINISLPLGNRFEQIIVNGLPSLLQTDGPQLGRVVGSRALAGLPLATRNFTQILTLSPGTASYLPDSTAVGRHTQALSVNGARVTQNSFQINGIDATTMGTNGAILRSEEHTSELQSH